MIISTYGMNKITDRIYIGPYHSAQALENRNPEGITHVLNCTPHPHPGLKGFKVRQLNIDDGTEIASEHIFFAIKSISEAVHDGGKILVHCHAGISRSVSMVCAYLMYNGFSWDEALDIVRRGRPESFPHPLIKLSVKKALGQYISPATTMLGDR